MRERRQFMFRYNPKPDRPRNESRAPSAKVPLWLATGLLAAGLTFVTAVQETRAQPVPPERFKVANIHFETNASGCDMGIQIIFDTEGIYRGSFRDPDGREIYSIQSANGMRAIGGQTEGFLEGVEPQITELRDALGCEPSDEEEEILLEDLFAAFPAGDYTLRGTREGVVFEDQATLTHFIPAGAEILAPEEGTVVPDDAGLLIEWEPVTEAILPELGPVNIVGYHVIVVEADGEALPQLDVDVPASETTVRVPRQYLKPNTVYQLEVLATEESGNQTISERFFCTAGVADCVEP
jgi:hypothetical protein